MSTLNPPEVSVGRREYDKLQADYIALTLQVTNMLHEVSLAKVEAAAGRAEIAALRTELKEVIEIWKTAKGVNSFIVWLSKFIIGAGIITAFFKWGPLK